MIPILMGIIVGQGEDQSVKKSFSLSLVYVLAMASTYTIVGILVGLSGENIQAWFQNPWIIGSFAAIFVALAMSMFGFYELQMPSSIQNRLAQISNNQRGGTLMGTAIMGFLSALIVGPCVTAPLVGALIYIAETGDAVLGGMALFALSMGMGAPLLVLGASAGKVLPKAGAWMETTKAVFGVLLLGLGIWLLERVAPAAATMTLWAALLIVSAIYMGALTSLSKEDSGWQKLWKGLGIILLVYGIAIFIGMSAGNRNVFQPLKGLGTSISSSQVTTNASVASHLNFKQIKGVAGLQAALAEAKAQGKPVMLDFYADWCVSCKEMEALTFADPAVQQALAGVVLLQADVTPNDDLDKALYKHFGIIGPPSIMFFDRDGNELKNFRVVGFMKAEQFAQHVQRSGIK
jgi:thiol:disulfide interchange protein DsbD